MLSNIQIQAGTHHTELSIEKATLGLDVINLAHFNSSYYFQDIGLKHTSFCQSAICYIDGDNSILLYRGYPIEQIAKHRDFTATMYLLLYGDLPTAEEKTDFTKRLQDQYRVPAYCYDLLQSLPTSMHPMGTILTIVSALSSEHASDRGEPSAIAEKIIAQIPTIVAMCQRHHAGLPPINPDATLDYVENFLSMRFGKKPTALAKKVVDKIFIIHAEHEQNASTCTMRVSSSTGTNALASLAAALTALWGPAHGGAAEACTTMLEEIQTCDRIPLYIEKAKSKEDPFRLMGFGHRVYRNHDPRAEVMKSLCHQVLDQHQDQPMFKLARSLDKIAREDPYFISHKLYPNVDFYSGIVQRALGFDNDCFTSIFALARTTGWMSHWLEMKTHAATPIIRPRQHYIGPKMRDIVENG